MESLKHTLIYIENHGLSIVFMVSIGILAWKHAVPYLKETTKTLAEIRKYFEHQNHNIVSGKALEFILKLKTQEIRWSLQKKILIYIVNNNLKKNWDLIVKEITLKIIEKQEDAYTELRDLVDKATLKLFMIYVHEDLKITQDLIIQLLENLKEEGGTDKSLYEVAERSVETHFEHFETRVFQKIKEINE